MPDDRHAWRHKELDELLTPRVLHISCVIRKGKDDKLYKVPVDGTYELTNRELLKKMSKRKSHKQRRKLKKCQRRLKNADVSL